jgi:hypothetical protein
MTDREATYYYSRTALAVLVSKGDPDQAIGLFEDLNSIFAGLYAKVRRNIKTG